MQISNGLQNILKKVKKGTLSLLTLLIEKGQLVLEQWVSMLISSLKTLRLKVSTLLDSIIKHSNTSNPKLYELLRDLLMCVVNALIYTIQTGGMLIFLLLLLMLVVGLFVLALLPALSLFVLMYIPTKLYQVLIK